MISYGPEISVPSSMVDLRNIWRKEVDYCFSAGIPPSKEEQPSCYNISFQENFENHDFFNKIWSRFSWNM